MTRFCSSLIVVQIESLRLEVGNYKTELEACLVDKEQIEADLENVYRALEDANDRQEERLMEAIAKERQQLKQLEAQVSEAKVHEGEANDRYHELEKQRDELEVRLNQAEVRSCKLRGAQIFTIPYTNRHARHRTGTPSTRRDMG